MKPCARPIGGEAWVMNRGGICLGLKRRGSTLESPLGLRWIWNQLFQWELVHSDSQDTPNSVVHQDKGHKKICSSFNTTYDPACSASVIHLPHQ
jgi:hypothetical protein